MQITADELKLQFARSNAFDVNNSRSRKSDSRLLWSQYHTGTKSQLVRLSRSGCELPLGERGPLPLVALQLW